MHCALEYYSLLTYCTRSFLWKVANSLSTPPQQPPRYLSPLALLLVEGGKPAIYPRTNRPAIYHPWRSFLWKAANGLSRSS